MGWTTASSVVDDELDEEQKIVIDLLNRFNYALSVEVEEALLEHVLGKLSTKFKFHIQREEG